MSTISVDPERDYDNYVLENEEAEFRNIEKNKMIYEKRMIKLLSNPLMISEAVGELDDSFLLCLAINDDELGRRIRAYFEMILKRGEEDGK